MINLINAAAADKFVGSIEQVAEIERWADTGGVSHRETIDADHYVSNIISDLERAASDEGVELSQKAVDLYTARMYAAVEKHNDRVPLKAKDVHSGQVLDVEGAEIVGYSRWRKSLGSTSNRRFDRGVVSDDTTGAVECDEDDVSGYVVEPGDTVWIIDRTGDRAESGRFVAWPASVYR
jgi:hypothetical protein